MFSFLRSNFNIIGGPEPKPKGALLPDFDLDVFHRVSRGATSSGFIDWHIPSGKLKCGGNLWRSLGYLSEKSTSAFNADQFKEKVHVNDVHKFECMIRRLINGKELDCCQFRMRGSNNKYVWLELRLAALQEAGATCEFISGLAYDITKLKKLEHSSLENAARYERILESSSDGVWEWCAQSKDFEFSNQCWLQLGYTNGDEILKEGLAGVKAWRERIHEEDGMRFDGMLERHIAYKEPFDIEYRIKAKDGSWRWIRARGQVSYDKRGDVDRMSGTNMDVTEIKRFEEDVLKSKVTAERANKAKSEFLSNMSHELRAPLNSIIGFTQLFDLDNNLTQEQRENISEIKSAGDHLLRLVGDVLDLAKIEAGGTTIAMDDIAPIKEINESISLVKPQADTRGVSIQLKTNNHEQLMVRLDSTRFKQVLINLLSNAIKYNRDMGVVNITISCPVKNSYRISVKDEGQGIPANLHAKIFKPFNRLGAEQTDVEGTGIGLVITKQLVEKMNGKIGFSSNEKTGSVFWVEFLLSSQETNKKQEGKGLNISNESVGLHSSTPSEPLDNVKNEPSVTSKGKLVPVEKRQKRLPDFAFSERKNILYIEENPSNQRLVKQTLSRFEGVSLSIAEDALRGIFEARTQGFDAIIVDADLLSMSSQDVLDILKSDPSVRSIPIILVSSHARHQAVESRGGSDFDYYLVKPLDLHEMLSLLQKILTH